MQPLEGYHSVILSDDDSLDFHSQIKDNYFLDQANGIARVTANQPRREWTKNVGAFNCSTISLTSKKSKIKKLYLLIIYN